ncbi:MAG: hypothetical protein H5T83_05475 [Actinotalea sp.]|nr:hypothetical protein [Actinotalea sp.]
MFDRIRAARTTVDGERLRSQAAELQAVLAEAGTKANVTATHLADQARYQAAVAKEWATPHVEHGVDWARPRLEKALAEGKHRAAPHVESAARRAVPVVDTAHDKLVDDLLPKIVAAVGAAAAATAAGADKAHDVTAAKLSDLAHVQTKKSHKGRNFFLFLALGGALAAAYQAWRRSTPTTDPWAEDPWQSTPPASTRRSDFQGVVEDVRHELEDAAEAVGEAAGEAVARTREATGKAKEATGAATGKATTTRRKSTAKADASTTQAIETSGTGDTGTTADTDVTPSDVAETIGTQLDETPEAGEGGKHQA